VRTTLLIRFVCLLVINLSLRLPTFMRYSQTTLEGILTKGDDLKALPSLLETKFSRINKLIQENSKTQYHLMAEN